MCSYGGPGRANCARKQKLRPCTGYVHTSHMQNTVQRKHLQWILLSRLINYIPMHMLCTDDGDTESAPYISKTCLSSIFQLENHVVHATSHRYATFALPSNQSPRKY